MTKKEKILKYQSRVGSELFPVSIQAGITDCCFNKCHMCGHHKMKNKKHINHHAWTSFLHAFPEIETVCYSGGDPLAHPDFNKIMKYHLVNNKPFGIITAGYVPPHINCEYLSQARFISISLDSVNKNTYRVIRGGVDYSDIVASLIEMINHNCNIRFSVTVSDYNKKELRPIICLARNHNVEITFHPIYGQSFEKETLDMLIYESVGDANIIIDDYKPLKPYPCAAVCYQAYVDAKGDIYPCCLAAGDTKEAPCIEPFSNIACAFPSQYWKKRNSFYNNWLINRPDICSSCIKRFNRINKTIAEHNQKAFF